ncbi:MAG: hypothetical protein U0Y10_18285 [Spirosomataceae bacterium]
MIQIGDTIQLRPSCFKDEFQAMKNGLIWKQKYLYEDEFEHVSLFYPNLQKRGEYAKTFWGNTQSQVIQVEYDHENNPFMVYTNLFWISFEKALKNNEIRILKLNQDLKYDLEVESKLLEDLEFFEKKYLDNTFDILERENNKLYVYKLGLFKMIKAGKFF